MHHACLDHDVHSAMHFSTMPMMHVTEHRTPERTISGLHSFAKSLILHLSLAQPSTAQHLSPAAWYLDKELTAQIDLHTNQAAICVHNPQTLCFTEVAAQHSASYSNKQIADQQHRVQYRVPVPATSVSVAVRGNTSVPATVALSVSPVRVMSV